jgi:aminoglycoside phosphotransferase (APT) family kinase protein
MVDETLVRSLVARAGIPERDLSLTPIPGGTVNQAYRIDPGDDMPLVLRIAPTDAEATEGPSWLTSHGLRREQEVIRLLDAMSELLPETVWFDESRELIDRDWVIQTMMPGVPWPEVRASLDDREHRSLWRELGEVTRRIHTVRGNEFGPPESGFGTATWTDLLRWDATGLSVDARRYGIDPAPMEALTALIDRSAPVLAHIHEPRLIHSDLGRHHVFVSPGEDGQHHITGLIDFEFGRFADPLSESIFVQQTLGSAVDDDTAAFCEGYDCPPFEHEDTLRHHIYHLVSLGWSVMDLIRRDQRDQVPAILAAMDAAQQQANGMI